jgi:hypothetical protein
MEGEAQARAGGRPGATQASPRLVHTAPAPTRLGRNHGWMTSHFFRI